MSMFEPEIKVSVPLSFYESPSSTAQSESSEQSLMVENSESPKLLQLGSTHSTSRSRPQACKVCGKVLSSASSYYVHMKLHSGNKPFACTICDAAFCRKPYLEVHMRSHTGERPFQCDQCLKRFTQKSSLNTHKRVHSGEKPFACDICEKRFAVKSYVTAHRWSHVNGSPLSCEQCKLTFGSKNQFAIHIRTHSRGRNHECPLCGRTFVRDSYLIRHQNRVHRKNLAINTDGYHFHYLEQRNAAKEKNNQSLAADVKQGLK